MEQSPKAQPSNPQSASKSARVDNTSRGTTSVDVEIYGAFYPVRGEHDREYLEKLAGVVDHKMREIGSHVPTVDTGKIAILAALNLADELLQCTKQQEGERVLIMEKVAELTGELTQALGA
jgi:cell division protein ZapA